MIRWSQQLIPTLREAPAEAEIPSHQLMLRAGLIRKLGGGLYTFLPLGLRSLRKVERIVREEMDRAGALEVLMPAMQPQELWEQTGRFTTLKDVMFKIKDRQERNLVLGPTHEEVVTDLVAHEVQSYRQLPINLYQIQTKFRDEIRPRFGLMRAKEFIMKDAYSFDMDLAGVEKSYQAMYKAYERIFKRAGLRTKAVEADTGAMGGSASHEFMVLAEAGEDGVIECDACAYAANLERAEGVGRGEKVFADAEKTPQVVATPNRKTITDVAAFFQSPPARLIKTLIYLADEKPVVALVPGDREVNEIKLKRALKATALALADDVMITQVTGAPVGFAGPVGLTTPIIADEKLQGYRGAITGANQADAHLVNVDLARDAKIEAWADISNANAGDGCPRCSKGNLVLKRGIEVGHVFKLGTKYSEALGAGYLDPAGVRQTAIMGCYGIGVTRTLQSVIEQSHDANGIVWPISIAPYQVEVLPINVAHGPTMEAALKIAGELEAAGFDVLFDDRDERPGVKFKDADLLGIPIRVNVGEKGLAKGMLEIKLRHNGEMRMVPPDQTLAAVQAVAQELQQAVTPA